MTILRRVLVVLGVVCSVAFLPSTAWATATPTPTETTTAAPTTAAPTTAAPTTAAPTTAAPTAAPAGTEADPLIVSLPVMWMAVFLLVGALLVAMVAALLVTSWGS